MAVMIGSIEASLRRIAHDDCCCYKVRRSVLLDFKADLLIYGNAERAVVEPAHRPARDTPIDRIRDIRGVRGRLQQRSAPAEPLRQRLRQDAPVAPHPLLRTDCR